MIITMSKAIALPAVVAIAAALAGCGASSKPSGGNASTTTAAAEAPAPAEFPAADGKIAFRRYLDDQQTTGAVFTINPDGTGERQVTHPPALALDDQPAWSPDGKLIAFTRCRADRPCGMWTVRPDGTHVRPVSQCHKATPSTRACADVANITFTPNGRQAIYTLSYGKVNQ